MHGNPDGSGLICNGSRNSLTDPPSSIGGKLVSFSIVELFHSLDQTQIALLNQIQKQHSTAYIPLCDADHQTQVRLCKALLRILIPQLHPLCQFDLLLRREQRHLADLLQIHADRILQTDTVRYGQIQILHVHIILIGQQDLLVVHIIIRDAQHVHIILLQHLKNLLELLLLKRHVRKKLAYFLIFQYIFLLLSRIEKLFHLLVKLCL